MIIKITAEVAEDDWRDESADIRADIAAYFRGNDIGGSVPVPVVVIDVEAGVLDV